MVLQVKFAFTLPCAQACYWKQSLKHQICVNAQLKTVPNKSSIFFFFSDILFLKSCVCSY